MKLAKFLVFLLGIAALAGLTVYAGAGAVMQALTALGLGGLAVVALLHAPVIAAMGTAWWLLGRGGTAPWKFMTARLVRDSVAEVLPFSQIGGYVAGARALHLMGPDLRRASLSMFADLNAEFAAKLPYALIGIVALIYLLPGSRLIVPLALGVAMALGWVGLSMAFRARIKAALERMAARFARKWTRLETGGEWQAEFSRIFALRRFLPAGAIHFLCWLFGALETWVIFALMGVAVTPLEALAIDSLVSAIRTFAFVVPAAAGVQETGYVLICALSGVNAADAIAFSFARRARDIAIGLVGLAIWQVLEARAGRAAAS
jgi:glycosyltransferase 2 family protein